MTPRETSNSPQSTSGFTPRCIETEFYLLQQALAFALKQDDTWIRRLCFRGPWNSFVARLFPEESSAAMDLLRADARDMRHTTLRARISDRTDRSPRRPPYFVFHILDDSILSQPRELSLADAKMLEELQDLGDDTSVREIHGVCAMGTRVRIYKLDTHSRTITIGASGGTGVTADALWDMDVFSEEGFRTLYQYVMEAIEDRSRPRHG